MVGNFLESVVREGLRRPYNHTIVLHRGSSAPPESWFLVNFKSRKSIFSCRSTWHVALEKTLMHTQPTHTHTHTHTYTHQPTQTHIPIHKNKLHVPCDRVTYVLGNLLRHITLHKLVLHIFEGRLQISSSQRLQMCTRV